MKAPHILSILAIAMAPVPVEAALDFETQVRPILRSNCFKCHGGPRAKKDFRMDKNDTLQEHIGPGKYIVPGKPQESEVIKLISLPDTDSHRMPPPDRGAARLTASEINILRQWITEGALLEPGEAPMVASNDATTPFEEPTVDKDALHVWKSTSGKEISAYFVRVEDGNLVLRSEEGDERSFPGNLFAPESIELAKQLATQ